MDNQQREELEGRIRGRFDAGDLDGAATLALEGYGPEIFSFLAALSRGRDDADEIFSIFAEALWRSLPRFGWQSSFRTWAYALARRTSLRYRRDAARHNQRNEPLSDGSSSSDSSGGSRAAHIAAAVRSATLPYLRSEVKSRIAELRAALPQEDQELLVLRVDRQLSWVELAQILRADDAQPLEGDALKREAARLRKRFQLVKEQLRERGRREGLLGGEEDER